MKILLTNDDGYQAQGINILRKELEKIAEVIMVAPYDIQSGKGAALNCWNGNKVHKIDEKTYAVEGTPVDCVTFALGFLNTKFDLLVSGCNEGWNISLDTMYSGTCGAAFQGLACNLKCIAFSAKNIENFTQINKYVLDTLNYIFENKLLSKKYYLNINLPDKNVDYKGLMITHTQKQILSYTINEKLSHDDVYYFTRHGKMSVDKKSDYYAVTNGFISISPMKLTTFSKNGFQSIERKLKRK